MDRQRGRGGRHRPGGRLTRDPAIEAAAVAASVGLDPMVVLRASSEEMPAVTALIARLVELGEQRDENLAVRIANAVGQVFGGKA